MKTYIAYEGPLFTIEWYYDSRGRSQALEYFNQLPDSRKRKITNLFVLMGDHGRIFNEALFRSEGNPIYAFKPQPDRYLCFFVKGKKVIIACAFIKKTQKLPVRERERAVKAFQSYETRLSMGTYYEKEKN